MEEKILRAFEKIMQPHLDSEIVERLLRVIKKMSLQEKIFLFQFLYQYPEKIVPFWEMTKKKFDYIKDGVGNIDQIIEEEIQKFGKDT